MRERPISVTIVNWMLIALGGTWLIRMILNLHNLRTKEALSQFLLMPLPFFLLVSGIGMLKARYWARGRIYCARRSFSEGGSDPRSNVGEGLCPLPAVLPASPTKFQSVIPAGGLSLANPILVFYSLWRAKSRFPSVKRSKFSFFSRPFFTFWLRLLSGTSGWILTFLSLRGNIIPRFHSHKT